jgi:hypothetical protein
MTAKPLAALQGRLSEAVSRWGSRGAELRRASREFREGHGKLDEDPRVVTDAGETQQREYVEIAGHSPEFPTPGSDFEKCV